MTAKSLVPWIAVVFAASVAAYFGVQAAERSAEAAARADTLQTLRVQLDTLQRTLADAQQRARRDSARLDSLRAVEQELQDSLATLVQQASEEAVAFGEAFDATMDSIRVVLAPPHKPLADTAVAQAERRDDRRIVQITALQGQIASLEREVANRDSMVSVVRRRGIAKDSVILSQEQVIAVQERQIELWRSEANPSFIEKFAQDWPWLTGSATVGAMACMALC